MDGDEQCPEGGVARQCKDKESQSLQFNTKKAPCARGHIIHSWDILLDMGVQGSEITLPQLLERTCKSQTISSLSFGSRGGRSVELDIITNLGVGHNTM